jgi:predicted GNAT family acetyltransferase
VSPDAKRAASGRDNVSVTHRPEMGRFEIVLQGETAVLDYTVSNGRMHFVHTGVPVALEGRGLGSQLARAGLEYAKRENLRVVPQCSFIRGYLDRHPEYAALLEPGS